MTITIPMLLFFFTALFLLACLLIMFFLSTSRGAKGWYLFFIASFLGWVWLLYSHPQSVGMVLLFIVPLLWIAGTMKVSAPHTAGSPQAPPQDEPRMTQEQLRGKEGTLQALGLYFFLLVIALVLFLTLFFSFVGLSALR